MRLPVGGLGDSSERVRLNGCAYQLVGLSGCTYKLVGLDTVLSGCSGGLGYSSNRALGRVCCQLVGLDTVLSGCTWAGVLTSWWAWIQFLPVDLSGCAYSWRVCLPVGGLGHSSERVHLNGCAYQLVGLDTVLSGCT